VSTLTHHVIKQYCAYKVGIKKYKYMVLGDDTLDSNVKVYNTYIDVIQKLGVEISPTKCTSSEKGSGEFAKRLFRKGKEVTGVPVHLLENLRTMPENFAELTKMMLERGYSFEHTRPVISNLLRLSSKSTRLNVRDQLSLPERISGRAPLLEVSPNSYAEILSRLTDNEQDSYLRIARDNMFFAEANKISYVSANQTSLRTKFIIKPNHPLVFAVTQKLEPFLGIDDADYDDPNFDFSTATFDDYSIYNNWIKGSYREMLRIPSIDSYKFRTKGHKIAKSKYLVLREMLRLVASNDTSDFLLQSLRMTDDELYNIGMLELQTSFNQVPFSSNKGVDKAIKESIASTFEKLKS